MVFRVREVWAEQVNGLDELLAHLEAERDENTCRKSFTPSEAVEMARRIEAIEQPKAAERQEQSRENRGANFAPRSDTGKTRQKVAEAVGVSHETLRKATAVVEAAREPDAPQEVVEAAAEMDRTGKVDPAYKKVTHVTHNSGNNEWYTPPAYIESARAAMGSIDTDPASCETANRQVQAGQFFTTENDGLSKAWTGNVWLNPSPLPDLRALATTGLLSSRRMPQPQASTPRPLVSLRTHAGGTG